MHSCLLGPTSMAASTATVAISSADVANKPRTEPGQRNPVVPQAPCAPAWQGRKGSDGAAACTGLLHGFRLDGALHDCDVM